MQSLLALVEDARRCRDLFVAAGMAIPEPLGRFLGEEPAGAPTGPARPTLRVPPPEPPLSPPDEALPDWIWIHVEDATSTPLVLAILRKAGDAVRPKDIISQLHEMRPELKAGTVPNIGTRLAGSLIARDKQGWWLVDPEKAPMIKGDYLWGPATVFGKYELAAHRRRAICHLLGLNEGGLQVMQIVKMLHNGCDWLKAPLTKDLVKADMADLAERGLVKRTGHSKKWILRQGRD